MAQLATQSNVASPTLPKPQGMVYPMTTPLWHHWVLPWDAAEVFPPLFWCKIV